MLRLPIILGKEKDNNHSLKVLTINKNIIFRIYILVGSILLIQLNLKIIF